MKTKITWATASYFIDVDLPIVPILSYEYDITWYILSTEQNKIEKSIIEKIEKNGGKVIFISLNKHWLSPASFFEYNSFFKNIKKGALYYINISSLSYTYLAAYKQLKDKKVIFATHNVYPPKGARLAFLAKINMGYLLKRFEYFHTFSENQKIYLLSIHKDKKVLCTPLAPKDYGPIVETQTSQNNSFTFLFFGHILSYKRLDLLINAAEKAYEESKITFKVIIAGKSNNWSIYEKLIKHPHLFDLRIQFIPDKEIPYIFSQADFLVLPYQDIAQSGALMVAFNYYKPVIVSDIPQLKEFVTDGVNGYSFSSESVDSLKLVILTILKKNPEEVEKQFRPTMKELVTTTFSLDKICSSYSTFFKKILS